MTRKAVLIPAALVFLLFSGSVFLFGEEETLDDLFDDPFLEDTVVEEDEEVDHRSQFETSDKILLRGSFSATGAAEAGWRDFPWRSGITEDFGLAPGAKARARISFDARPSSVLTIAGNIFTEIDPGDRKNDWTDPAVGELYADYNWLDTAFIRAGKFGMRWGQGRLFSPGNLMDGSRDGTAFRASFPTLLDGVSIVALANDDFAGEDGRLSGKDLAGAGIADKVIGGVQLTAAARYQREEGLKALGSFKTVLWRIDLFSDFVFHDNDRDGRDFEVLAGFFREWEDFLLYGEYYYDNRTEGNMDHKIGLAAGYKDIFGSPFDFGIEWKHAFYDNSGRILPGIAWSPWRHIKAMAGVPVYYGGDKSRFVDEEDVFSGKRRLSLAFALELSTSF